MGWRLLQATVFIAVAFSNIHWQWTPNGYLAAATGIVAAMGATTALSKMIDLWRWGRKDRSLRPAEKRSDQRRL